MTLLNKQRYHTIILFCVNRILSEIEFDMYLQGRAVASLLLPKCTFGQGTEPPLVTVSLPIRWNHICTSHGFCEA